MINKEITLQLEGITENPYGGFWIRLGAQLLDGLILSPVSIAFVYLNAQGLKMFLYTIVPYFFITSIYNIYLTQKFGGTPGKLIAKLKIIKIDGSDIGWKESILRYLPALGLYLFSFIAKAYAITQLDESVYNTMDWMQQNVYMSSHQSYISLFSGLFSVAYGLSLLVMLFNKQKRATHDFIAGTEVIKIKYLDKIRASMTKEDTIF